MVRFLIVTPEAVTVNALIVNPFMSMTAPLPSMTLLASLIVMAVARSS